MKKTNQKVYGYFNGIFNGIKCFSAFGLDNLFAQNENNYYGVVGAQKYTQRPLIYTKEVQKLQMK